MSNISNHFHSLSDTFKDLIDLSINCRKYIESIKDTYLKDYRMDLEVILRKIDLERRSNQYSYFEEKEKLYSTLIDSIKKHKTDYQLKRNLKLFFISLEKSHKAQVNYLFNEDFVKLKDNIFKLDSLWENVFSYSLRTFNYSLESEIYKDLLVTQTLIQYLTDIGNVMGEYLIIPIESELIKQNSESEEQPKRTFSYLQDTKNNLEIFFGEFLKISKPLINGSFKDLYNIVKRRSHKNKNNYVFSDLDKSFEDEILITLQELEYDDKKTFYYFTFLKNSLDTYFKNSFEDRFLHLVNNEPTKSAKEDLKNNFFHLERDLFFFDEKESLRRKTFYDEDPYSRLLTQEENIFFETIFNNYYKDWCNELKSYIEIYNNVKKVYFKYITNTTESKPLYNANFSSPKSNLADSIVLNASNDLPIFVYFLGQLSLEEKIELNTTKKSLSLYEKWAIYFNSKYQTNYFKDNQKSGDIGKNRSSLMCLRENTPPKNKNIKELIDRVKQQLIIEFPADKQEITKLISKYIS